MIPADTLRAFSDELVQIIKHAGALGKLTTGKMRPTPVPRVNLPVPKVV